MTALMWGCSERVESKLTPSLLTRRDMMDRQKLWDYDRMGLLPIKIIWGLLLIRFRKLSENQIGI